MLRINTCNNSNRLTSLIGPHRGKWGHWPQQRGFGVLLGFRHHLDFLLYMLAINVLSAKTSLLAVVLHLKIIGRLLFPAKVGRGSSWSTRRQCAIIDARYQFYSVDVAQFHDDKSWFAHLTMHHFAIKVPPAQLSLRFSLFQGVLLPLPPSASLAYFCWFSYSLHFLFWFRQIVTV